MRSLLLVRPDREEDIAAALESGADCLVLDLAQSIIADGRPQAREHTLAALQQASQRVHRQLLYVRVNSLRSDCIDADLDAVMPGRPDGIILPESQNGADVQHLSVKLAVREAALGLDDGATKIIAIAAATPASIFEMGSYRGASRRLAGLLYGGADLGIAACDLTDSALAPAFSLARSLTLFAAKAANIVAIDGESPPGIGDACLKRDCETAWHDGFSAKLAVEPDQVAIIGAVFAER